MRQVAVKKVSVLNNALNVWCTCFRPHYKVTITQPTGVELALDLEVVVMGGLELKHSILCVLQPLQSPFFIPSYWIHPDAIWAFDLEASYTAAVTLYYGIWSGTNVWVDWVYE